MGTKLLKVKVVKKTIEAEGVASFELVNTEGDSLPSFTAGSHLDVHIGDGLVRQYSLCNDPADTGRYRLGILKEPDSKGGSIAMHEKVHEGDILEISPPRNSFHLNEEADYTLLLAGGIGITPMLSMAHRLLALGKRFDMHYCTRSRERCAFHGLLSAPPFTGKVHMHFDDGPQEQLLDIPKLLQHYKPGSNVYVCGPKGFIDAVISNAEKHWPSGTVHREYFSADPQAGHDDDQGFEVKIASSGATYRVEADRTIAEVLLEQGIEIPLSCEQGICGTCLTPVVEGIPDHRDLFMTPAEHEANNQMTPCCSRSKTDRLVLDL